MYSLFHWRQSPADARATADRLTRPGFFLCIIARRTEARQIPLVFQMVASQFNCSVPPFLPSVFSSFYHSLHHPTKIPPHFEKSSKNTFQVFVVVPGPDINEQSIIYVWNLQATFAFQHILCQRKFIWHEASGVKSDSCHWWSLIFPTQAAVQPVRRFELVSDV